jgi:hypothetical protein
MERVPGTIALPVALEYPFWTEKRPEALARFGAPVQDADRLEEALLDAMDWLAGDAATRDPSAFDELLRGRVGIGGAYDVWRRAAAALRGERFRAEHGVEER